MRFVLAGLLALPAGFCAHMLAIGLLGMAPGGEARAFAIMTAILVAAAYEWLVRVDVGGRGE